MNGLRYWTSLILLTLAFNVCATPITYIYTGTASGTLGGSPFADADFSITASADTDNIVNEGVLWVDHITTNATISGTTYAISTALRTYKSSGSVGLSRSVGLSGGDLYNTVSDPAFLAWNMSTSLAPVTTTRYLLQWASGTPVETNAGILVFDDATITGTFEAILGVAPPPVDSTPIPTLSWWGIVVLITLLTGFAFYRRRQFNS